MFLSRSMGQVGKDLLEHDVIYEPPQNFTCHLWYIDGKCGKLPSTYKNRAQMTESGFCDEAIILQPLFIVISPEDSFLLGKR